MKAYVCIKGFEKRKNAYNLLLQLCTAVTVNQESQRPKEDELCSLVSQYDVIVIGVKEKMTKKVYEHASKLKFICTLSSGLDHIDSCFFNNNNIKVINSPTANVDSVAEYIVAYMLMQIKNFKDAHRSFLDGSGRLGMQNLPTEMISKKIGVIGAGKIVYSMIKMLQPFKPQFKCWTFSPNQHRDLEKYNLKFENLDKVCNDCDFLIVAIPLSKQTSKLLDKTIISKMSKSTIIVNISRMGVFNLDVLINYLNQGYFNHTMIDCFPEELEANRIKNKTVTLTPHIAGISDESRIRMGDEIIEGLKQQLNNG